MTRKQPSPLPVDVRAVLESPVGRIGPRRSVGAYEAGMRRAAEKAASGHMGEARRFLREMTRNRLLQIPQSNDQHQHVIRSPKEWDSEEWQMMYDFYGPPPWPGEHDGLIPEERWEQNYGSFPRPRKLRRHRNGR